MTDLASRRRSGDVLCSITFVFGGIHYGTVPVSAPYTRGKPIVLYVVPQGNDLEGDTLAGALDCLMTDDESLADEYSEAL